MLAPLVVAAALLPAAAPLGIGVVDGPMVFVGENASVMLLLTPAGAGRIDVRLVEAGTQRRGVYNLNEPLVEARDDGFLFTAADLGPLNAAPPAAVTHRPRVASKSTLRLLLPQHVGDVPVAAALFDYRGRVDGMLMRRGDGAGVIDAEANSPADFITLRNVPRCGGMPKVWVHKTRAVRVKSDETVVCTDDGGYVARVVIHERVRGRLQTRTGVALGRGR